MMRNLPNGRHNAAGDTRPLAGMRAYALAALCLAVAFVIRLGFDPLWGDRYPYIIFFAAVFVFIQLGRFGPFLFTLGGGFLLGDWFFVSPRHSLRVVGEANQISSVLYFLISFVMLYFTERVRRALHRERAARQELRQHADALGESQARYLHLFEHSPAPTWVEDWAALKQWLEALRRQGIADLRAYLEAHPERLREALGLVRVLDVNEAALRLTGTSSKAELVASLPKLFTQTTYQTFLVGLAALWQDECHIEHESCALRLDGRQLDLIVYIDVPRRNAQLDFANVIVTAIDITRRKQAEREREDSMQQLQAALAEVKDLSGLLPICVHCKKIRDDAGYWNQIEFYIKQHSNATFSHGFCPECAKQMYPEVFDDSRHP